MTNSKDQLLGCLIGGALGDAIGSHFENAPAPDTGKEGFVWGGEPSGEEIRWRLSDDTQLTLATCQSIIETGGDADTNASIFGQIAGAEIGYNGLPNSWKTKLQKMNEYLWMEPILKQALEQSLVPSELSIWPNKTQAFFRGARKKK